MDYLQELQKLRGAWKPEDYSARFFIPDSRICIASDVHLPYHDEALLAEMFERCRSERIEAIVFLGDLMDMHEMSSYGVTDHSTDFKRALAITRGVIQMAAETVQAVYWSKGNHEHRLMRKLDNYIYMEQLARMVGVGDLMDDGRLIVSDNPSLDAADGTWLLTHPGQYGSVPLAVPSQLAKKYGKNVMSGHAHHWGMGAVEGYTAVETGGLFKAEYHQYIQYNVTNHRQWVNGYWLLLDGEPHGYRKSSK